MGERYEPGQEPWQRCPGLDRTSREGLRKIIEGREGREMARKKKEQKPPEPIKPRLHEAREGAGMCIHCGKPNAKWALDKDTEICPNRPLFS